MPTEALIALSTFAFVTSITPGPNNLMLLASGMNYGFSRTIPHMLGISMGFFVMCVAVGMGLGEVFARFPVVYAVMKWVGIGYLLYLAWRISTAGMVADNAQGDGKGVPLTFIEAAMFQWVNPKAWAMAVSAFSTYAPATAGWMLVLGVSALFTVINLPCVSCWAVFGTGIRRWLHNPRHARIFNIVMALLLVATLTPLL